MSYHIKRTLSIIPVIFGVITLSFFLIHFIPGDPIDIMLGDQAVASDKDALRTELGLNQPLIIQYKNYLYSLIHFDLGRSLLSKKPVLDEILEHIPATLELTLISLFLSLFIGIPLGVWAAIKKGTITEHLILSLGMLGLSIPAFCLGPLLIWVFAIEIDIFPVSERGTLAHTILPAFTLSSSIIALLLRMTRTSMLDVIHEDYIRVARAKGISSFKIYFQHGLINALFPLITLFGILLGSLLTGTVIVETIFDWPGIGQLIFNAIQQRDYPLVQGCVLFVSLVYVSVNWLTDLMYTQLNPKVDFEL